ARLPRALWQARRIVREFRPDVVVGVGGYASGPVVLMARLAGIPTAICEQNSLPGLPNKIPGRIVRAVFVSFAASRRFFQPAKTTLSGNPVRRGLVQKLLEARAAAAPATSSRDSAESAQPTTGASTASTAREPVHVLVSGGSLGAVAVNPLAA